MRGLALLCVAMAAAECGAQFDYGASISVSGHLLAPRMPEHRSDAVFSHVAPTIEGAVNLRFSEVNGVRLVVQAEASRRQFHVDYLSGGLRGGTGAEIDVVLHVLYGTLVCELIMDSTGRAVMVGLKVGKRLRAIATGQSSNYGFGAQNTKYDADEVDSFGGDVRFVVGLRNQLRPMGRWRLHICPEVSVGVTSFMADAPGCISVEAGIAFGFWRTPLRSLTASR